MSDGPLVNERLRAEMVRGRARSVLAVLCNETDAALRLVEAQTVLGAGAWKQAPPALVPPHTRVVVVAQGVGLFVACRATITYASSSNRKDRLLCYALLCFLSFSVSFHLFVFCVHNSQHITKRITPKQLRSYHGTTRF